MEGRVLKESCVQRCNVATLQRYLRGNDVGYL